MAWRGEAAEERRRAEEEGEGRKREGASRSGVKHEKGGGNGRRIHWTVVSFRARVTAAFISPC
jgi:hypothetical protein